MMLGGTTCAAPLLRSAVAADTLEAAPGPCRPCYPPTAADAYSPPPDGRICLRLQSWGRKQAGHLWGRPSLQSGRRLK